MQIILIQTEVEQAIRDYVTKRMTLAEGTTISIELNATRGAEGMKATIDLNEPGQAKAPAAATPVARTPKIDKVETQPMAPVTDKGQAQGQQTGAEATSGNAVTEDTKVSPEAAAEAAAGSDAKGEAAEGGEGTKEATGDAPAAPKSLFAGLNRPKNS